MDGAFDDALPDEFSELSCFERDDCLQSVLRSAPPACLYCRLDQFEDEG
jgi:hypothetical protein